jgi:hypothetical protein
VPMTWSPSRISVGLPPERDEGLGSGGNPRRDDQHVEGDARPIDEPHTRQTRRVGIDCDDLAVDESDVEGVELFALLVGQGSGVREQHHVRGELAEQQRLVHCHRSGCEYTDALIADLPAWQ